MSEHWDSPYLLETARTKHNMKEKLQIMFNNYHQELFSSVCYCNEQQATSIGFKDSNLQQQTSIYFSACWIYLLVKYI